MDQKEKDWRAQGNKYQPPICSAPSREIQLGAQSLESSLIQISLDNEDEDDTDHTYTAISPKWADVSSYTPPVDIMLIL